MEFHQLAAVVAVADHGSFTGAAEALGHSQPSISLAVRRLEREVGIPLFERLSTGVVPTAAGEALLGPARQALRDRDIGLEAVAGVSGLTAGHLDIACIPTLAADIATPIIGAFRRLHDHVSIRLREPEAGTSVEDLVRQGQSELGFCALPAAGAGLAQLVLEDQELVASSQPVTLPPTSEGGRSPSSDSPTYPSSLRPKGPRATPNSPQRWTRSASPWSPGSSPITATRSSPSSWPAPAPPCSPVPSPRPLTPRMSRCSLSTRR